MDNKEISKVLKLGASILELHGANDFKVRSYTSAIRKIEGFDFQIADRSYDELLKVDGIGKSLANNLVQIVGTGSFDELTALLQETPKGVVDMLSIKGIGAKKVRSIWKDLGIETKEELLKGCDDGRVSELKGFGAKTAENIKNHLLYEEEQEGKFLYAEIEQYAQQLLERLKQYFDLIEISGHFRLQREFVDKLEFVVGSDDFSQTHDFLNSLDFIVPLVNLCGPYKWVGKATDANLIVELKLASKHKFYNRLLSQSASVDHLYFKIGDKSLSSILAESAITSEQEAYKKLGKPFLLPELRESTVFLEKDIELDNLLAENELKGILHNHSTYSDGKHTLREMAEYCKSLGYEYLGISDHSKTAFYANGLDEDQIAEQHREIDQLNIELAPFKIFKGIESDILNDGSLDYDNDVLATFDFIVASIHSNLTMDSEKATQRLITAIENPYTTILGHPTGRLLLRREGYPIDHKKVIDACAANGVIIEINANPWRLDLDWRYVDYAMSKNVMLAINPDAHEMNGYHHMKYGVLVGRKGGLTTDMTFNVKSLQQVEEWFVNRRNKVSLAQ